MATTHIPPVFDGHNDVLMDIVYKRDGGRSFLERSDSGHIDLPRAVEGGFGGGMFAIFIPNLGEEKGPNKADLMVTEDGYEMKMAAPMDTLYAQNQTLRVMAELYRWEAESDNRFKVVRNTEDLLDCLHNEIIAAVLHFEGAEAIDPELEALHLFYRAGLRSLGLTWSRPNVFGFGVPFRYPHSPDTGPGLTDRGVELIRECNRGGIMVDLAHLNERGFWDVARITDKPLVVTHAAVHAICPSARNLTDRQLDAIGESGGVVGVTFCRSDLRPDGGLDVDTPAESILKHIDYIVDRIGINHIAFGSDFDGATIPSEVGDVTGYPKLFERLCERGYDTLSLRKIAYENWVRVLQEAWNE